MNSIIFKVMSHIVAGLMLIFSVFLLFRGHNEPGGGFIAALIAVTAFSLLMLAESPTYVRTRIQYKPMTIAVFGAITMIVPGLLSAAYGLPYLTGLWWKDIVAIGTPLFFDIGVYLAIIGSVLTVLLRLDQDFDSE